LVKIFNVCFNKCYNEIEGGVMMDREKQLFFYLIEKVELPVLISATVFGVFAVIFGCLGILSAIVENAYENMYYVAAILLVFVGFFALF